MKSEKIIVGLLAGTAICAVAAIVFMKGKETKTGKKLMAAEKRLGKELKQKFSGIMDMLSEKFDKAKNETEEFVTERKARHNGTMKEIKEAIA
jgi:gas vesicle protein